MAKLHALNHCSSPHCLLHKVCLFLAQVKSIMNWKKIQIRFCRTVWARHFLLSEKDKEQSVEIVEEPERGDNKRASPLQLYFIENQLSISLKAKDSFFPTCLSLSKEGKNQNMNLYVQKEWRMSRKHVGKCFLLWKVPLHRWASASLFCCFSESLAYYPLQTNESLNLCTSRF